MNSLRHHVGFDLPARHPTREERKPTDMGGWFRRSVDNSYWDFRITNLSYGGCQIQSSAPLERGERVKLCVQRRGNIEGTVCWRRGDAFGLSFKVEKPEPVIWPRKAERHAFDSPALLRRAGRRAQMIDARDVSLQGCCLQLTDSPQNEEMVWVKLPGLEALEATVCWTKDFACGVKFKNAIYPAVFALLLARGAGTRKMAALLSRTNTARQTRCGR